MKKLILASILGVVLSSGAAFAGDHCDCKKCKDKKEHCDSKGGDCACKDCSKKGGSCGEHKE